MEQGGSNSVTSTVDVSEDEGYTLENHSVHRGGAGGLNERLDTEYIDVSPDDTSPIANITRTVTGCVGRCCTPRQILIILRLLKAITFCFLCLTIAADLMYIFLVELMATDEMSEKLGGSRDTIIRVYGLALALVAVLIEVDFSLAVRHFVGLKGFIPRSLLLFFVATLTNTHPLHDASIGGKSDESDDDYLYNGDSTGIPNSAVVFQMITSWVLGLCAICYFFLGMLCFDRFTSKAFLSSKDPVASTAIPPSALPSRHDDREPEAHYEAA